MEVYFLGYRHLDFITKEDNKHIFGYKIFYCFKSNNQEYYGYECGSYFIPENDKELIDKIIALIPLKKAFLNFGFNGKKPFLCDVKSL